MEKNLKFSSQSLKFKPTNWKRSNKPLTPGFTSITWDGLVRITIKKGQPISNSHLVRVLRKGI